MAIMEGSFPLSPPLEDYSIFPLGQAPKIPILVQYGLSTEPGHLHVNGILLESRRMFIIG